MQKTLNKKLARILGDSTCRDFILADAKDADMAYGLSAYKSMAQFRQQVKDVVEQGLVDIMLLSASNAGVLAKLFDNSPITPAIRANDTTDIWQWAYSQEPSRPFRSASLRHAVENGIDLGLYSVTLNNNLERDLETLIAYKQFREEAESFNFRHFLEVFSPNVPVGFDVPNFVNNQIVRILAGVASKQRPVFLKIPYFGPKALETLVQYDDRMIVGILGGAAGSTLDTFQLLADAKKYGARAALFGRRINSAEHQLTFIKYLRAIADGEIEPTEALKEYKNDLHNLGISPAQ